MSIRLWTSAELWHEVDADFAIVSREVEKTINGMFSSKDYGTPLLWNHISIILPSGFRDDYVEIAKYNKRRNSTDFRLRIDYEGFRAAPILDKYKLFCASLRRSILLLPEVGVPKSFKWRELLVDFDSLIKQEGWI